MAEAVVKYTLPRLSGLLEMHLTSPEVTAAQLDAISASCPRLRKLSLDCKRVVSPAFQDFLRAMDIKELSIVSSHPDSQFAFYRTIG
jgi:hypothetical protein